MGEAPIASGIASLVADWKREGPGGQAEEEPWKDLEESI